MSRNRSLMTEQPSTIWRLSNGTREKGKSKGKEPATNRQRKFAKLIAVIAAPVLFILPMYAALGGDASSVRDDQARINATVKIAQTSSYAMHELQSSSGTIVREFVSSSGKVFAVAWRGPWAPNLKLLLGTHFEEFQQALKSRPAGRGPVSVHQPDLVVELGGHMRSFMGRAYLPDEIPASVREEELR